METQRSLSNYSTIPAAGRDSIGDFVGVALAGVRVVGIVTNHSPWNIAGTGSSANSSMMPWLRS